MRTLTRARLVCTTLLSVSLILFQLSGAQAGRPIIVARSAASAAATEGEGKAEEEQQLLPYKCHTMIVNAYYAGQAEVASPATSGGGAAMADPNLFAPAPSSVLPCLPGIDCFDAPPSPAPHQELTESTASAATVNYSSSGAGDHDLLTPKFLGLPDIKDEDCKLRR